MRRSLARFSAPVSSVQAPSWADFITTIVGFRIFGTHNYENGPWNDYRAKSVCWYDIKKFCAVFPEYRDLSVNELAEKLYPQAGIELTPSPNPWLHTWKGSSNCDNRTIVDLRDSARDGLDISRFQTGLGE
jgi:hypothetical protein